MQNLRGLAFPIAVLLILIASTPLSAGPPGQRNLSGITLIERLSIRTDRDDENRLPYDLALAGDMYIDG